MKDNLEFPIKGFLLAKEKKHSLHFNGGIKNIQNQNDQLRIMHEY